MLEHPLRRQENRSGDVDNRVLVAERTAHMTTAGLEKGSLVRILGDDDRRKIAPPGAQKESGEPMTIHSVDTETGMVYLSAGRSIYQMDPRMLEKAAER